MEGLGNRTQERITFLNVINGKIARKATKDEQGAVSRINKNQIEVWEMFFDSFTGRIVKGEVIINEKMENQKEIHLTLMAGIDKFKLQVPLEGKFGNTLAVRLRDIKGGQYVKLEPYSFDDPNGPDRTGKTRRISGMNVFVGNSTNNMEKVIVNKDNAPSDMPKFPESKNYKDEDEYRIDVDTWKSKMRVWYSKFAKAELERINSEVEKLTAVKPKPTKEDYSISADIRETNIAETDITENDLPF